MNISVNTIPNTNYKKTLNFKSSFYNAKTLQNIPELTCACCGKKIINLGDVAHSFSKVSLPLSEIIKSGALDMWREIPTLWKILAEFGKKYPNDSYDKIAQSSEAKFYRIRHCLVKAVKKAYPEENFYESGIAKKLHQNLLYSTRAELIKAGSVMNRFEKYKKYLNGSPLEAFEQLQIYAQKYPDKRLSEIVAMDEIYNFHKTRSESEIKKFNDKQDFHFNNITKIVKAEDPLALLFFHNTEVKARNIMISEKDPFARIPRIKELYEKGMEFVKYNGPYEPILNELDKLESSYRTEDVFFAKAYEEKWTDAQIIKNILNPFTGTFEHIIPRSQSGNDMIFNGIIMCKNCNISRGARDYKTYLQYHPKMVKNTQRQINHIIKYILSGKIDDESIVRWPIKVSENLSQYTDGLISPEIGDYCERILALTEKRVGKYNDEIQRLNDVNNQFPGRYKELLEEIKHLKEEIKHLKEERWINDKEIDNLKLKNKRGQNDIKYFQYKISKQGEHNSERCTEPEELDTYNHQEFTDDFCSDDC